MRRTENGILVAGMAPCGPLYYRQQESRPRPPVSSPGPPKRDV